MSLHRNWVKFNGIRKERGFNRHHVTINHNGQIHLGRQAHTDLNNEPASGDCEGEVRRVGGPARREDLGEDAGEQHGERVALGGR